MSTTSAIASQSQAMQALLAQSRQNLQSLQTDVSSSNLSGAKSDFAAFQQDAMNLFQGSNGQLAGQVAGQTGQTGTSQTSADLQALQSALSSGNVTGAQQSLASFQQDLQTHMQGKTHGHHHHHQGSGSDEDKDSTAGSANPNGTGITGATGAGGVPSSAMTLASLLSAYQAFNPASAAMTGTALSVFG